MKLIIFGPPGSGKGVYSKDLSKKFNLKKISTGDVFREILKQDTELGKKVKEIVTSGGLIDDNLTNKIAKKEITNLDGHTGFILDGYPRTINQANFLDSFEKIDALILIKCSREVLIEKTLARRNCKFCGYPWNIARIYKTVDGIKYELPQLLPTKDPTKCDHCGNPLELIQRHDDNLETVKNRLELYDKQTAPIIDHYRAKKIPFVEVWFNRAPEFVVADIVDGLKKLQLA